MDKFDIVVVGGGPSGMLAAGSAAVEGRNVLLLEKMDSCGRKLCITGKGKCNLTNGKKWDDFSTRIHPYPHFFRPAFRGFSNEETVKFFNHIGIETFRDRGDRIFPVCLSAPKVRDALVKWATDQGVKIVTGAKVVALEKVDNRIKSVQYHRHNQKVDVMCKAVILATGGLSFPATGSDGVGHAIAKGLGHTVTPCFPSLTGLMPEDFDTRLQGVTLNNIALSLMVNGEVVREEFGEVIFTDLGFEGSLGYKFSRQAVTAIHNKQSVHLIINLKAAIPPQQLPSRWQRDILRFDSEPLSSFMRHYLPRELVRPFIDALGLHADRQMVSLTPAQKERLQQQLTQWEFPIARYAGYDRAIATAGGVSIKEIQKKDMRSKIIRNLFFAGELIDLDGDTGGYNLQIAFSTGALAGKKAAEAVAHEVAEATVH